MEKVEVMTMDTASLKENRSVTDDMMIYRGNHYCQNNEKFVRNFQKLYEGGCIDMLLDENVFSDEMLQQRVAEELMHEFVRKVS